MENLILYLSEYGYICLFVVVLLEYMNLPGFPSGVIMPLAGFWIAKSGGSFLQGLIISVLAGLVGSWILYAIGRTGGEYLLQRFLNKFPSQRKGVEKNIKLINEKGAIGIFISKLLPVARTIIPIPAGVIKFDFTKYTIFSALGIIIWNASFMASGYYFGETAVTFLSNL